MTRKIDLMIIGALKAGTTSLKSYLNEHPEILGHAAVDMKYFREEEEYKKGYDAAFKFYFNEGNVEKSKVVVAKHAGTYLNPSDYKKIHEHNPDCRIVFIIRNPVERAYSNYNYEYSNGRINVSLEDVIKNMDSDSKDSLLHQQIIRRGQYADYLTEVFTYFKKENVRVYLFDDLIRDPVKMCREIFEWMGIDPTFVPETDKIHNKSQVSRSEALSKMMTNLRRNKKLTGALKSVIPSKLYTKLGYKIISLNASKEAFKPMDEKTKKMLVNYYEPYNEKLQEMTGLDFSHWKN